MTDPLSKISSRYIALAILCVPLLLHMLKTWFALPLPYGTLLGTEDPDPWLRLTQVRDLMLSHDWYNHHVHHSDAPFGNTVTPWTRPLDLVLAFFATIQPHSVDLSLRLLRAALINPILWTGLFALGLFRALSYLSDSRLTPYLAAGMLLLSVGTFNYFSEANADHHSMLATLFVWALGGVVNPAPTRRETILSGLFLALQLWVSPEAFVLILGIYGWYGLHWLRDNPHGAPLPLLSVTVAIASTAALMIEYPPDQWFTPLYDTISIVYVFILALCAILVAVLYSVTTPILVLRLFASVLGVGLMAGLIRLVYPLALQGPLAGLDPYAANTFMRHIKEAEPLVRDHGMHVVGALIQPFTAALIIERMAKQSRPFYSPYHQHLFFFLLALTGLLFSTQVRFYYYLGPVLVLALAPLGAAILTPTSPSHDGTWPSTWLMGFHRYQRPLRALIAILATVLIPYMCIYFTPQSAKTPEQRNADACKTNVYKMIQGGALDKVGNGRPLIIFTSTNYGGEILFWTHHRIIASNYHREVNGIRYLWESDKITDPQKLRAYLDQRQVDLLLLCSDGYASPKSVFVRLYNGDLTYNWLETIPYELPPKDPKTTTPELPHSHPLLLLVHR